jgi:ATP-dependent DNA helicase RecG
LKLFGQYDIIYLSNDQIGGCIMKKDENLNIEYKREFIDDIKNEIIAFLNTSGGKIYVGINDDKTTYKSFDVIERDQIDLKIGNWMEDAIFPSTFGLIIIAFSGPLG